MKATGRDLGAGTHIPSAQTSVVWKSWKYLANTDVSPLQTRPVKIRAAAWGRILPSLRDLQKAHLGGLIANQSNIHEIIIFLPDEELGAGPGRPLSREDGVGQRLLRRDRRLGPALGLHAVRFLLVPVLIPLPLSVPVFVLHFFLLLFVFFVLLGAVLGQGPDAVVGAGAVLVGFLGDGGARLALAVDVLGGVGRGFAVAGGAALVLGGGAADQGGSVAFGRSHLRPQAVPAPFPGFLQGYFGFNAGGATIVFADDDFGHSGASDVFGIRVLLGGVDGSSGNGDLRFLLVALLPLSLELPSRHVVFGGHRMA